jgi:DNA invertase Pin-like site-specific DNA recombinase
MSAGTGDDPFLTVAEIAAMTPLSTMTVYRLVHELFADIGIPRDGGLADLLTEAASPEPRFAAVICENIERSGRDTYYSLQLEKQLTLAGTPLFATDEPIDVAGATTVLVRRIKQGVAE